jgi:hypothetical protein
MKPAMSDVWRYSESDAMKEPVPFAEVKAL